MIEINQDKIIKALNDFKEQRIKLDSAIQPFFSDKLNYKQRIELNHVGKFVTLLDKPAKIVKQDDSPDFIILYDEEKIGLEHERIFKTEKVEMIRSVTKLFTDAEQVFKAKYPNRNILIQFWLNTDNFSFRKSDTHKLKNDIAEYAFCLLTNNESFEKPSYIKTAHLMKHSQVSFCYNPGGYVVNSLDKTTLENAISKKECLIDKYKKNSGIHRQWLLIVIGSPSPDSFEFEDNPFQLTSKTNFERVYLLEDLNARIWRII